MVKKAAIFIVIIILSLVAVSCFAQLKVSRSSDAVTVEDSRLFAKYNFGLPRYNDTTEANLHLGLDSCGTAIFTRSDNKIWKRKCSPKKWEEVGGSVSGSSDLETTLNNGSALTTDHAITSSGYLQFVIRQQLLLRGDSALTLRQTRLSGQTRMIHFDEEGMTFNVGNSNGDDAQIDFKYPNGASPSGTLLIDGADLYLHDMDSASSAPLNNIMFHDPVTKKIRKGHLSETDPVWTAAIPSYRTKAQNDLLYYPLAGNPSGFLTSFTETDPIWTGVSSTYRTKTQNDALYYPLSTNPAGYLTSFTEADPVFVVHVAHGITGTDISNWNAKQNAITTGTTAQYFRGDLSLATFPTNLSSFTNGPGYLTSVDTTNISNFSVKVRSLFSANAPITYSNGLFGITQATTSTNGYLSSTDWNTFNGKQAALSGTGFIKATGSVISYDNSTYLTTATAASTYAAISHSHAASDITSGTIATARLGSGTANSTTYLAGDQTYKTAFTQTAADALYSALGHTHTFASLTSKPTTLSGYGITDAQGLDATLTALAGLATGASKIPYSTGTDAFGQLDLDTDGTLSGNSDTKVATQKAVKTYSDTKISKSQAAYTMMANNTNATANVTNPVYYQPGEQTYSGGITWTGTPPSSVTSSKYIISQIGKEVTLKITLLYGSAGTTNTQIKCALPADAPTPYQPMGRTTAGEFLYVGFGWFSSGISSAPTAAGRVVLQNDATYTFAVVCTQASTSANYAYLEVHYTAQ